MTKEGGALAAAMHLMHTPSRVRTMRAAPLPEGIGLLLQIANDDEHARVFAVGVAKRTPDVVKKAAEFFIEQILLAPDSDSYRLLGATADASTEELRRNMALMLKWLHPDLESSGQRAVFARRVTLAWQDLKTPEKRASYDSERARRQQQAQPKLSQRQRMQVIASKRQPTVPGRFTPDAIVKMEPDSLWRRIVGRLLGRRRQY